MISINWKILRKFTKTASPLYYGCQPEYRSAFLRFSDEGYPIYFNKEIFKYTQWLYFLGPVY
jgi:hypothetical protein